MFRGRLIARVSCGAVADGMDWPPCHVTGGGRAAEVRSRDLRPPGPHVQLTRAPRRVWRVISLEKPP